MSVTVPKKHGTEHAFRVLGCRCLRCRRAVSKQNKIERAAAQMREYYAGRSERPAGCRNRMSPIRKYPRPAYETVREYLNVIRGVN